MTREEGMKRPKRLRRGRPPKDDLLVRELALAHEVAWGLGPQQARDLALAVLEGRHDKPMRLPRGSRKVSAGSKLAGYELPLATFEGRERSIARKTKRGDGVRRDVVVAFVRLLRAKDDDLIECLRALGDALSAPTVAR
jgi:hypothetical protein